MPHNLAVQVIALVGQQFMLIDRHAQQMTATVGQPADLVPVRTSGGGTQVEGVVLVLPHRDHRGAGGQVVLVFTNEVAGLVMEPLQFARGVDGLDQPAVAVVGKGFFLALVTLAGHAGIQAAYGVEE
ncbi:hypothetical protein CR917_24860 [Pseudomonas sp. BRM28]|nr:hypothetical protein CR917_24860 [Pseudomonas sp. BRM28]